MHRRWLLRGVTAVALAAAVMLGARSAPSIKNSTAAGSASAVTGVLEGSQLAVTPDATYRPDYRATPPTPTAAQRQASEAQMARSAAAWAARKPQGPAKYAVPGPSAGTGISVGGQGVSPSAVSPNAPGDAMVFRNSALAPSCTNCGSSVVNEPSHAAAGKNIFYTGNWYAARSVNTGVSWGYINPYADFPSFCCDQDVIYDRGRNLHLWERQGVYGTPAGQNLFKLSASTDGGATFCTYTLQPTSFNSTFTNQWFDYPHMAVSNNYLYLTFNMFNGAGAFLRHILMKWSLDQVAACASAGITFWTQTAGWSWTPVQGTTDQMYLGDQLNPAGTLGFRVYWQPESNSSLFSVDRTVPAWTFTNGNAVCTVPNGANPCARSDQRVLQGWVTRKTTGNTVGFSFNVAQGGTFPKPYTNVFLFNESGLTYNSRPYAWNSTGAWMYASFAPNVRGDLAGTAIFVPTGAYPRDYVLYRDDFSPAGWASAFITASTGWLTSAQGGDKMGDYTRTRAFNPTGTFWSASNYVGLVSGTSAVYVPRYFVFGRQRDLRGWLRFGGS